MTTHTLLQPAPTRAPARRSQPGHLLRTLLEALDRAAVTHVVTGVLDGLPDAPPSDVDLVVAPERLPEVPALLARAATRAESRLVQAIPHEHDATAFVFAHPGGAFLTLDVAGSLTTAGRRLLPAAELLAGRRTEHGLPVPAPAAGFAYVLLKRLAKGTIEARHGRYLAERYGLDPRGARRVLDRHFPSASADLLEAAARSGDWSAVTRHAGIFRATLHAAAPRATARELARLGRRIAEPVGLTVSVLGPDGSGKSTLIAALTERLAPAFKHTHRVHFRPGLGRNAPRATVTAPHAHPPRSRAASLAKVGYYVADYALGHAVQTVPRLLRGGLVVFDRYFPDLLADPRRYRLQQTRRVVEAALPLVPAPALTLVLDVPADVVQARVNEVSPAESVRQRAAYLRLIDALPHAFRLDGTAPPEVVLHQATAIVLDHLARRTAERLVL